jgi:hypothetical protein
MFSCPAVQQPVDRVSPKNRRPVGASSVYVDEVTATPVSVTLVMDTTGACRR